MTAADTVAPVAVTATPAATDDFQATDPTMAVDPLDALIFAMHPMYDHGRNLEATMIVHRVQDVIEAALIVDTCRVNGEKWATDLALGRLANAAAAYRAWAPSPDAARDGGGGGEA